MSKHEKDNNLQTKVFLISTSKQTYAICCVNVEMSICDIMFPRPKVI